MATDGNIVVSGVGWAKRHKRDFDAVITCEDPDTFRGLRFHRHPHPEHLILKFVDLDEPAPEPYADDHRLRLATSAQIESALALGRDTKGRLLVHCQVGIGRSTAVALAILAMRLGLGKEQEALEALLAIRPQAVPNLHVVKVADGLLGLDGRLLNTVIAWDVTLPNNQWRRAANRLAHFRYHGLDIKE